MQINFNGTNFIAVPLSLSLSLCLSVSLSLCLCVCVRICSVQCGEEQHFQLNTDIMLIL